MNIEATLSSKTTVLICQTIQGRRVHGCGGSIASLLKNETKIFLPIFDLKKIFHNSKY
jgi:hypothetical protein